MKKMDFQVDETIEYAGSRYKVLENHGTSGKVEAIDDGGVVVCPFYWSAYGEDCKRVKAVV